MKTRRRILFHTLAVLFALIASIMVVTEINKGYWDVEPFPGGATARELRYERPWVAKGINQLIQSYSLPIGVIVGLAIYGTAFCILEIKENVKYLIAVDFLHVFPASILGFVLCAIPMFCGIIAGVVLALICVKQKAIKGVWLSIAASMYNLASLFFTYNYFGDWFRVFGD